jgi:hypothetical protein
MVEGTWEEVDAAIITVGAEAAIAAGASVLAIVEVAMMNILQEVGN